MPMIPKTHVWGSGVVVMSSPQLTTVLCPPADKSDRNKVHVPLASCPSIDPNIAVWPAVRNADGGDCGAMFTPSGCQVPNTSPPAGFV